MASTPGSDAHAQPHGALHNDEVAHEDSDISISGVLWFVVILFGLGAIIQVGMVGLFKVYDRVEVANDPFVSPLAAPAAFPPAMPEPRLQTTPWLDLQEFRAGEDAYLSSYGWVDQKTGVAHLPIEKAKALLLQRGLPARAAQDQDPREGTHRYAYGESTGGQSIPAGGADTSAGPGAATPAPGTVKGPGL